MFMDTISASEWVIESTVLPPMVLLPLILSLPLCSPSLLLNQPLSLLLMHSVGRFCGNRTLHLKATPAQDETSYPKQLLKQQLPGWMCVGAPMLAPSRAGAATRVGGCVRLRGQEGQSIHSKRSAPSTVSLNAKVSLNANVWRHCWGLLLCFLPVSLPAQTVHPNWPTTVSILPDTGWQETWGLFDGGHATTLMESASDPEQLVLVPGPSLQSSDGTFQQSQERRAQPDSSDKSTYCGGLPFHEADAALLWQAKWQVMDAAGGKYPARISPMTLPDGDPLRSERYGPDLSARTAGKSASSHPSIVWARVCFAAGRPIAPPMRLLPGPETGEADLPVHSSEPLATIRAGGRLSLRTGRLNLAWDEPGHPFPSQLEWQERPQLRHQGGMRLKLMDPQGIPLVVGPFRPEVIRNTPDEAVIEFQGKAAYQLLEADGGPDGKSVSLQRDSLGLTIRFVARAGIEGVAVELLLTNPHAAQHPDNIWVLGDRGSRFLGAVEVQVRTPAPLPGGLSLAALTLGPELSGAPERTIHVRQSLQLEQRSSGRPGWKSPRHVDFQGQIAVEQPGYRLKWDEQSLEGAQAAPILALVRPEGSLWWVPEHFWEQFPRSVAWSVAPDGGAQLHYALLPEHLLNVRTGPLSPETPRGGLLRRRQLYPYELQGGETLQARFFLGAGPTGQPNSPTQMLNQAQRLFRGTDLQPDETARRLALSGWGGDTLLQAAEVSADALEASRMTALSPQGASPRSLINVADFHDAYGWRDFGEFQADHETNCGQKAENTRSFISQTNNQYDVVAGLWRHWLRTGQLQWLSVAAVAGRHTATIDTYQTREDTSAYNGGLFWHTTHDTPVGRSTHRSYPAREESQACTQFQAGGPGLGHVYVDGLLMGWLISGDRTALTAALSQGRFVLSRWRKDSRDREPRAQANALQTLVSLCAALPESQWCQAAWDLGQSILEELQEDGASTRVIASPDWQEFMRAEALLRWQSMFEPWDQLALAASGTQPSQEPVRASASTSGRPSFRAQPVLLRLCERLMKQSEALPLDVNRERAADVLAGCQRQRGVHPDFLETIRTLHASLTHAYWARGTYSNAKELTILLTSGGRAREIVGSRPGP